MPVLKQNPLPGVPHVESPLFDSLFREGEHPPWLLEIARSLHENGYAVFQFPDPDFDRRANGIVDRLSREFASQNADGTLRPGLRMQDACFRDADVLALAANASVLDLLTRLYGRKAWPFQTLNFPMGTQQHYHTDAVHFSTVPERFMCGVWVALEDIGPDQGPLEYYPGSHKWPIYTNEHIGRREVAHRDVTQEVFHPLWEAMVAQTGVQREIFCPRKGEALIWASNLLHGGMAHRDTSRTRWSQVTHYYFDDCGYYTPMNSDPYRGLIRFREPVNILTRQRVQVAFNGEPVQSKFVDKARLGYFGDISRENFDGAAYLAANPDVAASGSDPWQHFVAHGRGEGRRFWPLKQSGN
jgi:hypothetical protein